MLGIRHLGRLDLETDFVILYLSILRDGEVVLGLAEELLVDAAQRCRCILHLRGVAQTRSVEFLLLLLLHVHDHLQVAQFLGSSEVVDGVDEGLFPHGHDLLTDVLDDVVFDIFEPVFLLSR